MKKFKYLMMAGAVAMLFACSDDGDSGSGSGSIAAGDGSEQRGLVVVDESNSIIKPYTQKVVEGCFRSGLDFSWKTVDLGIDQTSFKYEFLEDTLVLYSGKSYSESGRMYVGGEEDNLNGTWKSTLCYYDHFDEKMTCYKVCSSVRAKLLKEYLKKYKVDSEDELDDDALEEFNDEWNEKKSTCIDDGDIYDITIKISGDDFTMVSEQRKTEEKEFTDYMNSEYISGLYEAIYYGRTDAPSVYDLADEDSAGVKSYRKKALIKEKKKTENSVTFVIDEEETVSVSVDNFDMDEENDRFEVSMTVTWGKKECKLNHMEGRVNKGDCNSDNIGKFDSESDRQAEDGTIYKQIYGMEDSNMEEFNTCVEKILKKLVGSSGESAQCTSAKAGAKTCVDDYMDYYGYTRSYAEEMCNDLYSVSYYCVSSLSKTATSTAKSSKSTFKQLQRAHINDLEALLQ